MKRRDSLKYLVASSGLLLSLPAWAEGWTDGDLAHTSSFTPSEQELLAAVADTIIPAGNSIGALTVGVDKFLQKLIDNCYEADVQSNVKTQLAKLNEQAQTSYQKAFNKCAQKERETLLLQLDAGSEKSGKDFFTLIKSETIRGFNTSKEVMLQHLKYKIAPGHYYGCVDVKA